MNFPETQHAAAQKILAQAAEIILGKQHEIRLALTCLLAGGHLLLDDLPGLGKTTLAQTLARLLGLQFSRIQFTSDLLPADVIGVSVFSHQDTQFRFLPGPIFAQLILADELNRATPKTQSALLEAMEEGQVTADGQSHRLPQPFFVIATQNPAHQIGTFPLPESQLDRFLICLELGYPDHEAERRLLSRGHRRPLSEQLLPVMSPESLIRARHEINQIHASEALIDYVQALLAASRRSPDFVHGLSPRAGLGLLACGRAWAWLDGRQHVLPDDIQAVFPGLSRHRLRHRQSGRMADQEAIDTLLKQVALP